MGLLEAGGAVAGAMIHGAANCLKKPKNWTAGAEVAAAAAEDAAIRGGVREGVKKFNQAQKRGFDASP